MHLKTLCYIPYVRYVHHFRDLLIAGNWGGWEGMGGRRNFRAPVNRIDYMQGF